MIRPVDLMPTARELASDLCQMVPTLEDGIAGLIAAVDAWESLAAAWGELADLSDDEELRVASARVEQLRALATASTVRGVAVLATAALVGFDVVAWSRRFSESDSNPRKGGASDAP